MAEDLLFTVSEAAKLMKVGRNNIYALINAGVLPVLKLGSYKIRRTALEEFAKRYEGYDLSDPNNITKLRESV